MTLVESGTRKRISRDPADDLRGNDRRKPRAITRDPHLHRRVTSRPQGIRHQVSTAADFHISDRTSL